MKFTIKYLCVNIYEMNKQSFGCVLRKDLFASLRKQVCVSCVSRNAQYKNIGEEQ